MSGGTSLDRPYNPSRRGFLQGMAGILAAGVAPAAIGSNILMPVKKLWTPPGLTYTIAKPIAYCMGWTITNNGPSDIILQGLHYGDEFCSAGNVIISPRETLKFDTATKAFSKIQW